MLPALDREEALPALLEMLGWQGAVPAPPTWYRVPALQAQASVLRVDGFTTAVGARSRQKTQPCPEPAEKKPSGPWELREPPSFLVGEAQSERR